LEPADLAWKAPYYQALKKFGVFLTTLEVIRDEADTLVFWGANPLHSCPRHLVRYSFFARGRFTERGHEERRLAVVDIHRTELAELAQVYLEIKPGEDLARLEELQAGLTGGAPPAGKSCRRLLALLQEAAFGVIFFGRGVSYGPAGEIVERLAALTARLNEQSRFVLFPLSTDFNAAGLYHLLLRELGSPLAPDFGNPPEVTCHAEPVAWDQVDAILVAGADLFWFLSPQEVQQLQRRRVPVVALSPLANRTTGHAHVVLPVALAGVETAEVAYRMDGLPLSLAALVPTALPSDAEVLRAIAAAAAQGPGGL
jgi:formylmethanofuran dehydrogenase subunit B